MADIVNTEGALNQAPQEPSIKPLEQGITRVSDILRKNLGAERAAELMPADKAVTGITQENFQWQNRYVEYSPLPGPEDRNPSDGEIYSIKFHLCGI